MVFYWSIETLMGHPSFFLWVSFASDKYPFHLQLLRDQLLSSIAGWDHKVLIFLCDLFYLTQSSPLSPVLFPMIVFHSVFWLISHGVYVSSFLIYVLLFGHLACFYFLATINSATVSLVCWSHFLSRHTCSTNHGWHGSSCLYLLKKHYAIFSCGCINLLSVCTPSLSLTPPQCLLPSAFLNTAILIEEMKTYPLSQAEPAGSSPSEPDAHIFCGTWDQGMSSQPFYQILF